MKILTISNNCNNIITVIVRVKRKGQAMIYGNTALSIPNAYTPTARRHVTPAPNMPVTPKNRLTSAELCQMYIDYIDRKETTVKGYLSCIRRFSKWLAENGITLQEASREDMKEYRNYLNSSGLKAGTRSQYFRAAKALVHWAYCEGLILEDIGDNLHGEKTKTDGHKRDAVPCDAITAISDSIDRSTENGKRLYAMLMLTTQNGFRTVELSRANVGDIIQNGDDFIIFVWGKGHDEPDQKQYLLPEVKAAIDDYLLSRTDKYTSKSPLFVSTSNKGKPGSLKGYKKDRYGNYLLDAQGERVKEFYDGRIAPNTISTMLKNMLVNAGYSSDRLTAHSLRHTSGTAAFKCGLDLYDVQHLMRHCDPKTTEIYIHTDDDAEREKTGRRAIYDYLFNGQTVSGIMPELEAEIMTLTPAEQQKLLEQIRAQKGATYNE